MSQQESLSNYVKKNMAMKTAALNTHHTVKFKAECVPWHTVSEVFKKTDLQTCLIGNMHVLLAV